MSETGKFTDATGPRHLIAVVGATGTGKSEVAVAIAEALEGEVLGADAYQVYRGLDVGAAKLSQAVRDRVPHQLVDIAQPSEPMTLALFLEAAREALDGVWRRGRLPVLAGGSGQYVWAVLEGWQVPRVEPDPALRSELEALAATGGHEALRARLAALDPEAARTVHAGNTRRVIRAIEVISSTGRSLAACQTRVPIDAEVLILGLRLPRDELYARVDARTDAMYAAGFVREVERLREEGYGDSPAVRGGVGYKEVSAYLDGEYGLEEAISRHKNANHRLVRRQNAWFRESDERIRWLDAGHAAAEQAIVVVRDWLRSQPD